MSVVPPRELRYPYCSLRLVTQIGDLSSQHWPVPCALQSNTTPCYLLEPRVIVPAGKQASEPANHPARHLELCHCFSQQLSDGPPAAALKCLLATRQSARSGVVVCVTLPCTESPGSLQASACRSLAGCLLFFIALLLLSPLPAADSTVGTLCTAFKNLWNVPE